MRRILCLLLFACALPVRSAPNIVVGGGDDTVRAALLRGEGPLGQLLDIVRACEQNRFADLDAGLSALPHLSLSDFNQAQMQALGWANELSVSTGG